MRARKRYVLLEAEAELTRSDLQKIGDYFERGHLKVTLIRPRGNGAALIAKTDVAGAAEMRESSERLVVGGKTFRTSLTSGNIGKLKRRAAKGGTS